MNQDKEFHQSIEQLAKLGNLREEPFRSDVPVLGPLIVRLRTFWNSISTRWYVMPLLQQQSQYNMLLVQQIQQLDQLAAELREIIEELDERIVENDRDTVRLGQDLGKLAYVLGRLEETLGGPAADQSAERD